MFVKRWNTLRFSSGSSLTPGQMLLMGFNGLFTRLQADFSDMLDAVGAVQSPDVWRKVDRIKEARAMQVAFFVHNLLDIPMGTSF